MSFWQHSSHHWLHWKLSFCPPHSHCSLKAAQWPFVSWFVMVSSSGLLWCPPQELQHCFPGWVNHPNLTSHNNMDWSAGLQTEWVWLDVNATHQPIVAFSRAVWHRQYCSTLVLASTHSGLYHSHCSLKVAWWPFCFLVCYGVSLRNSSLVSLDESTNLTLHPTTTWTGVLVYKSVVVKGCQ